MGDAVLQLPEELRRVLRRRVLKEGRIVIRRGWSLIVDTSLRELISKHVFCRAE